MPRRFIALIAIWMMAAIIDGSAFIPKSETHLGGVLDGEILDWTYDGQGRLLGVRVNGESQYGFSYGEWRHPEGVATKGMVNGTWSEFDPGTGRPGKLELGRLTVQTEYDDQGRLTLRKNFVVKNGQPPEEVTRTMPTYTGRNCTGVGTLKGTWLVDYNTTGALSGATRSATGHAFSYATGESGRDLGMGGYVDDRPPRRINEAKVNVLGSVTPGAAVTIEGIAASVSGAGEFNKAYPGLQPGWHGFDVVATKTTLGVTAVSEETVQAFVPPASEELSYDGNGNLSEDARYEYRWNAKNQLVESEEKSAPSGETPKRAVYKYDGGGRRVEKTIHAGSGIESRTTFLWEGWHVVREIRYDKDNKEVLRRDYTWGPDVSGTHGGAGGIGGLLEIVEKKGANTTTNLVLNDGLGNVVGLVDADTGKVVALYEYGPFGEDLGSTGERADSCPFRYQTKYLDETGLYYWGLRHYVPKTRTWASRDPLREGGGANMYAYCNNRPFEYCDAVGGAPREIRTSLIDFLPATGAMVRGGRSPWGSTDEAVRHSREFTIPVVGGAVVGAYGVAGVSLGASALATATPIITAGAGDLALSSFVTLQNSSKVAMGLRLLAGYHIYNFTTDADYRAATISIDGGTGISSIGFAASDLFSAGRSLAGSSILNPRNYDWRPVLTPFRGGYAYSGIPLPGLPVRKIVLSVKSPKILQDPSLSLEEVDLLLRDFQIKKTAIQRAAAAGRLVWSPGTNSIRVSEFQAEYRLAVSRRFMRRFGEEPDFLDLNADHPVDLLIGGSPSQRLKLINESINKSIGASLLQAGRRAGLQPGDIIDQILFE